MTRKPTTPRRNSDGGAQARRQPGVGKPATGKSGASQSEAKIGDRLTAYLLHHQLTAVEALVRLLKTPLQSLLTWLVVAIALALPTMLYIGLANVQNAGKGWQSNSQISVFIHKRAKPAAVEKLSERLLSKPHVASLETVSPEQALAEFQTYSGFGQVLETLDENPLPLVLLVQPSVDTDTQRLAQLREQILAEPVVDDVRIDMAWVQRLHELMNLGQRLVMALGGLLALGVLLVIGNTVRLAIENRRDEIVIVKLVGGTDAFVRRPFLYTGFWYGVGGGLLALLIVGLGVFWLSGPVARLATLYQSSFVLEGIDSLACVQLVLGAGALGLGGAWLAVGRHLSDIEPR